MNTADVARLIKKFVDEDRGNFLPGEDNRMFDSPLVGFCSADDPLFDTFLRDDVIGGHHLKPKSILTDAETVISYFLPIKRKICRSNRPGSEPSQQWIFVRFYGELFNERLRRFLNRRLQEAGYSSAAPSLNPVFESGNLTSNWSERHAAYASGLGTFGLHAGLITSEGVAGRFGSVITSLKLPPTPRPYQGRLDHCRFHAEGLCSRCLTRCPVDALSEEGKDKEICREHLRKKDSASKDQLGFPYAPCGKCYVDVPCERNRPV